MAMLNPDQEAKEPIDKARTSAPRYEREPAPVVIEARHDLTRTTFAVLFIFALIAACFRILRPFLPALMWSTMIVVATWTPMRQLQATLWHRRWLAVTVMTILLVLAFVVPFALAVATVIDNADEIAAWVQSLDRTQIPELPAWVRRIPVAGPKLVELWHETTVAGAETMLARLEPYARAMIAWFVSEVGTFGYFAAQLLLTVVISAILYAHGESAASGVRSFFRRLVGRRGDEIVELSGQAIRGVAFGVIVTALVQSVMGGVGLAVCGVPFVALLTALMFILAVAQIGAAPVLFCVVAWMYWQGDNAWATALLVWTLIVSSMDNVLRPVLIRRGGHLPLLLVFAGVLGGLVAFGLVGIFVGPLVLAVSYRLIDAWVREGAQPSTPSPIE